MRKKILTLFALCGTLLWAAAVYADPPIPPPGRPFLTFAPPGPPFLTFAMPPCPIKATTTPPTKGGFQLPSANPLGVAASVAGTVEVTDQNGDTVILLAGVADVDLTANGVTFSRTVKTLTHAVGQFTFDKGCTATDPYGSNKCHWDWAQMITAAYQGALQEDITSGEIAVDLTIDNTIPLSFTCPVCGASCTIQIPWQIDNGDWGEIWDLMIFLIQFAPSLTTGVPPFLWGPGAL